MAHRRFSKRGPSPFAGLCLLLCLFAGLPVVQAGFLKHLAHGIAHAFHNIVHEFSHIEHEIAHGVDHVFHEIEHGVEHLAHEVGHEVAHLAHEVEHAYKKVLHAVCSAVHFLERGLLEINEKIFGPELGAILDKIEMGLIEAIPGVGQVVTVLVDGVDIVDEVDTIGDCWKKKDFSCVGHAIGGIVGDVSGAASAAKINMKGFGKGFIKVATGVEKGCEIADECYEDYEGLSTALKLIENGGFRNLNNVAQALSQIGTVLQDLGPKIDGLSEDTKGQFHNFAAKLASGVDLVEKDDKILLGAVNVGLKLQAADQCIKKHDYTCLGNAVGGIVSGVGSELATVDGHMTKLATKLTDRKSVV